MAAKINRELCTGCGECVEVCPADAIEIHNGRAQIDPEACVDCGLCASACPTGAIHME